MKKEEPGRIHIYCGDGKGKTTAALGLALRAAGRGRKVLISRFLKTEDSGEVPVLRNIPGIEVMPCQKTFGFTFQMSDQEKKEAARYYEELFQKAWDQAEQEGFDMLVLDEMMAALSAGFVKEEQLLGRLQNRPEGLEVVMTGRNPSERLVEAADYVSEIRKVKHPFDRGVGARTGIEL